MQHFWSLAIEEQFYLLLPPLLLLACATRSLTVSASSSCSRRWLVDRAHGPAATTGATLDRLYYGTDTRAGELLVGSVLAVVLHPRRCGRPGANGSSLRSAWSALATMVWCWVEPRRSPTPCSTRRAAAYALVVARVSLCSAATGGGRSPPAARGGARSLCSVASSYGIYLYHWPIFLWLTRERTGLDPWPLFGLRLAVTLLVATASYHLLEMPIRNRAWSRGTHSISSAVAPAAACIVLGAFLVSDNREVVTDLAGLGEEAAPPPTSRLRATACSTCSSSPTRRGARSATARASYIYKNKANRTTGTNM